MPETSSVPPRILFLSNEAPHSAAAGSIVLKRLLDDYPADRLLVVSNSRVPRNADKLACRYEHLPLAADRLNRTRLWPLRAILRTAGFSALMRLDRVRQTLRDFKPDIVLCLMQDSWFYDYAARFARADKLPLVLIGHDVAHGFEPVPRFWRSSQLRRDTQVYRQAASRLCISAGMEKYHKAIFGVPSEVLLPPRSDNAPSQDPQRCRTLKTPGRLTLGYAGGLHYGYGEQIRHMVPALRQTKTVLELFCPQPGGPLKSLWEETDVLHFNEYAPTPERTWRALLEKCDVVLQPYLNPPGDHELQYRTHFPSKLGDCLGLGIPLLITGPQYASGVSWCLDHPGCAHIVSSPLPTLLSDALLRLRDDADLRVSLATKALNDAAHFDLAPIRSRFLSRLHDVAAAH